MLSPLKEKEAASGHKGRKLFWNDALEFFLITKACGLC